jgi:hemolysin III
VYLSSTLVHSAAVVPRHKRLVLACDHAAIFVLIAGSYTPFAYGGSIAHGLSSLCLTLLLSGMLYSVVAYLCRRLRWNHTIWHVAVVAANAAHFGAVLSLIGERAA